MWGATVCGGLDFWGASVCGGLVAISGFGGLVCVSLKIHSTFFFFFLSPLKGQTDRIFLG